MGTVIKEIKIKKIKLIIPQKTEPKKIKDRVSIILSLVILLKKNGGRKGEHSEIFGYLLSDLQYMQRAFPNSKW